MKKIFILLSLVTCVKSFAQSEYTSDCSCQVVRDYIVETQDFISGDSTAPSPLLGQLRSQYQIKIKCLENLGMKADAKNIKEVLLYNCSKMIY